MHIDRNTLRALAVAGAMVAGCASQSNVEPLQVPAPKPTKPQARVSPPAVQLEEGMRWKGEYTCTQGETLLTVTITDVSKDQVEARFDFFVLEKIEGSYLMRGEFDPDDRHLVFKPFRWLERPVGYMMVGMDGHVSRSGRTFAGVIPVSGCTTFETTLSR